MFVYRNKLQEAVTKWQTNYRDPEKKFDTLQDFLTANVGVIPTSLVERPPSILHPLKISLLLHKRMIFNP